MIVLSLIPMKILSSWQKAGAKFEGKVSLFEATLKGSREAISFNGVNGCLGSLKAFAVRAESVIVIGPAYGTVGMFLVTDLPDMRS